MREIVQISRGELEELVRALVAKEVKRELRSIFNPVVKTKEQWGDVKALCAALQVSRQTVSNWRKSPKTGHLINPFIEKQGGRLRCNIAGIKAMMRQYEAMFGEGREYGYKYEAIASEAKKQDDRFKRIRFNVMVGNEVSESDKAFYEQECKLRGERSRI